MKKKATKTKAPRKSRAKPELYFVIGGDIDRTKCATAADATEHAKGLLRKRAEANGHVVLGVDPGSKDGGLASMVEFMKGAQWNVNRIHRLMLEPKIERQQCVRGIKPLYIVKVVAVVEMKAAPIVVRKPKPGELSE